jgi:SAM-dependent methyltransferase
MHDTAFHIGTLAMNIYSDLRTDSILEVGSQAVNGSLRESALPRTRYLGVDIEEGEGVDLVIEPGKPLPVEDDSFDLVMATSVFEHDPCFWMTFLEMCRATKDGGYIYINAPSNGVVHRYPQDNWRFYPDSGRALAQWAASQDRPVTLVESFVAKRDKDIWNDFVAVFRKGRITRALPKVFLHEHVPCSDVITWKSKEIINPSQEPEDVLLLNRANERAQQASEELDRASRHLDLLVQESAQLKAKIVAVEGERQELVADCARIQSDLNLRESELRQRQEEIEQTRSDVSQIRLERDRLRLELSGAEQRLQIELKLREQLEGALKSAEELLDRERARCAELVIAEKRLTTDCAELKRRGDAMNDELAAAKADAGEARSRLGERFQEVAVLSNLIAQLEVQEVQSREQLEWMRETSSILLNGSRTFKGRLLSMLPAALQHKRQHKLLKRRGLFDGEAYLAAHPDVAADGVDPLGHYLKYGIAELRRRA